MTEARNLDDLWPLAVETSSVGMAVLDGAGTIVSANQALRTLVGQDEMLGRPFQQFTRAEDLNTLVDLVRRPREGGDPPPAVVRFDHGDATSRWAAVRVTAVHDDDGRLAHVVVEAIDITAQRDDEQRLGEVAVDLEHERGLAQAILDTVDVGLVLIDSDGHYERMNRRHADFMGLAFPHGHRGRAGQLGAVFAPDGVTRLSATAMPSSRSVRGEEFDDYRIWVGEDPLTRRALSVSGRNVLDGRGGFGGAALAYTDVTDATHAERSRNDFVATVSHELRTPLTSILSHVELLLHRPGVDSEAADDLAVSLLAVQRNAQRLQLLVSDLVESAQQQRGSFVLDRVLCDVSELVRETASAAGPLAERAGIDLVIDAPAELEAVVDAHRLRQVLDNLLSNAFKYAGGGGRVVVRAALDVRRGAFELTVGDTGPGIAREDRDRVFLPFFRSEGARLSQVPGVGLGLAVVRSIVVAHGGDVSVYGDPGHGSTFRVRIPLGGAGS